MSFRFLIPLAAAMPLAFATSSFNISPTFTSNITGDANAAAIEATINTAIGIYNSTFIVPGPNPVTVHITFDESGSVGLGQSDTAFGEVGYASYCNALQAAGTPGSGSLNCAVDPFGGTDIGVKSADLRALGLPGGIVGTDGTITFNPNITNPGSPGSSDAYALQSVIEHEIDEVLGLGSGVDNINNSSGATITSVDGPMAEDLFRYSAAGVLLYSSEVGASCGAGGSLGTAYFSTDGGNTNLAGFNNACNGGDWGDWDNGSLRVQNAFATPTVNPALGVEITALEAVGYDSATPEPATFVLVGSALLGAGFLRRRATNRKNLD